MRDQVSILPLRIEGLDFAARGARLLSDVTLTLRPHRRLVILGPNGAGKSLLLRLCHGILQPTAGRIRWAAPERAARAQAMVFQHPVLLRRSVRANLAHGLALAGLGRGQRRTRVAAALDRFGLGALGDRPARRLSGGERQRLALARAWALRPEVLFLDEPSAALDPAAARAIEQIITGFGAEGMTIAMTTHDLGQARRLAQDVAFLHKGRLVEAGPAEDFFRAPASEEARAFIAGELLW